MKRYIIEVPEEIRSCSECKARYLVKGGCMYACSLTKMGIPDSECNKKRADWCPLQETTMKSQAEIEHEWTFKETQKEHKVYGVADKYNRKCTYTRIDVYYCKKTCEIKEVTKEIEIPLMWGGTVNSEKPIWY